VILGSNGGEYEDGMQPSGLSETFVNLTPVYTALQPRRQSSSSLRGICVRVGDL
jgi:hypothetical protein